MLTQVAANRCFGGVQAQYTHPSAVLGCTMTVSVFLPPGRGPHESPENRGRIPVTEEEPPTKSGASRGYPGSAEGFSAASGENCGPFPALYWLSGLSCTDQNFVTKAGAQRVAAELGVAIIAPDTSPRGANVPGDPDGAWDFGHGAGFYVDATEAPWSANYRMYTYIRDELPAVLSGLPLDGRRSITGHSMGGHGALVLALRNPGMFRSVSAFAPICAPSQVPWGEKALGRYLGPDRTAWQAWDATALVATAKEKLPILVDQGLADSFLATQLQPERLEAACAAAGHPLTLRRREGYDHSYYFIASFLEDHLKWHAAALKG